MTGRKKDRVCPECGEDGLIVAEVEASHIQGEPVVWRRQLCSKCRKRFTTYEVRFTKRELEMMVKFLHDYYEGLKNIRRRFGIKE